MDKRRRFVVLCIMAVSTLSGRLRKLLGIAFDLFGVHALRLGGGPQIDVIVGDNAIPGQTGRFIITGKNLREASSLEFDNHAISGAITASLDTAVAVTVTLPAATPPGLVSFTIQTPSGRADSRSVGVFLTVQAMPEQSCAYDYAVSCYAGYPPGSGAVSGYSRAAIGGDLL